MSSSATNELTDGVAIQPFVLLAKKTKGKATAAVIQQALNAPNTFVFGELLDMPNVQQLSETEDKKMVDLLKIFAYGTYSDYRANSPNLPQLTPLQTKKLQQLTIVTLAAESKVIPYEVLQRELDISNLRELEDLIIDAIYQGIFQGKLDQKHKQIEVEYTMGRDLKPESLVNMISLLHQWNKQSETLLQGIKEKVSHAELINDSEKKRRTEYEKRVESVKTNIKLAMEADMLSAVEFGGEHPDFFGGEGRRGPSKMKGVHKESHQMSRRGQ